MRLGKFLLIIFIAAQIYLASTVDISSEVDEDAEKLDESDESTIDLKDDTENSTEIVNSKKNGINITWENVLNGIGSVLTAVGDFFVKVWNSVKIYIRGEDSGGNDLSNNVNKTELSENINRTLWNVEEMLETMTEFNINKVLDMLFNSTVIDGKAMANETKKARNIKEASRIDLETINQSTSEEEMLSGILLSCCYFALFIICWLFAYIKDRSDWVSTLKRPNEFFLQQIRTNASKDDRITLFEGLFFPFTKIYLLPKIELNIGKIRILTVAIQILFFPLTIIHFVTSKFNISHFHFEHFYTKIKDCYDIIKNQDFVFRYYYLSNKDQRIGVIKEQEIGYQNYSEKNFVNGIYSENIYILSLLRYLSNKDNIGTLPTNDEINNWCEGFWFRVNKLTIEEYKELLPRLSCLILLKKFVNKEQISHDYLRRLNMQVIGANLQGEYVRDWIKTTLQRNNPKLDMPFNWIQRRPAGSIIITLQDNGIIHLIRSYKRRIGVFAENQIKLLYDITSGNITNLDCYLWFTDELQTICIHPVVLCDCIKGYDSLEWLGPIGFIPFDKLNSGPINDKFNGSITLILNDDNCGNSSSPFFSGSNNSGYDNKNTVNVSFINSAFHSLKNNDRKNGVVGSVFQKSSIIQIKFIINDDFTEDISSFNYILNGLLPKSKLRLSSNSSSTSLSILSNSSTIATESNNESPDLDSTINTLPNSVLNEETSDVFWGDKLSLRSKNRNTGDYELEMSGTCYWDFDTPIPYTANTVLLNGVLTYIWINYDSRLLCIQRKGVSIEEMGDHKMIKRSKERRKEIDKIKNAISISHLKSFDDEVLIESFNTTPGSDSYVEILNLGSILNEPESSKLNTINNSEHEVGIDHGGNVTSLSNNNSDKWIPFDRSLSSVLGVLTNNNAANLHPVYAVPGVLCGAFCTRGYFIGSIINIKILCDSKDDIVEEYVESIKSQLLITFEGGLILRICTFSKGSANSIKESLESILNNLENSVMLPMKNNVSKLIIDEMDNTPDKKNEANNTTVTNNLSNVLFSLGVSPPDLVVRCDQIIEYENLGFMDTFIKSFTRFNPITGRLQWNPSSPRIYRWLSYTASTSISHFLIFYLLSTISKINKIENGILVGWISYCILNISKLILDSAMNFNAVFQILNIKQQAAYSYLKLWIIWLTSSFCFLATVLLSVLTILQSTKPGNNIGASSGFILNDINYSISTWIAGFILTFLSLIIQPLFLSLSYSILALSSRVTSKFDGIVAFFNYFNNFQVLKNGIMPVRPCSIIKKM